MTEVRTVHGHEVVIEFDPETTFTCLPECSWCCGRGVELYPDEPATLATLGEGDRVHETPCGTRVPREPKARDEHVDVDGAACVFLDDDGRCGCERAHDWKPARCSVFPLAVEGRDEDGRLRVGLHAAAGENCPGLGTGERIVDGLAAFLPERVVERPATGRRGEQRQ